MSIGDRLQRRHVSQARLGDLGQVDTLERAMDEESGVAFVLDGERRVVVNAVEEPRRRAEHE